MAKSTFEIVLEALKSGALFFPKSEHLIKEYVDYIKKSAEHEPSEEEMKVIRDLSDQIFTETDGRDGSFEEMDPNNPFPHVPKPDSFYQREASRMVQQRKRVPSRVLSKKEIEELNRQSKLPVKRRST